MPIYYEVAIAVAITIIVVQVGWLVLHRAPGAQVVGPVNTPVNTSLIASSSPVAVTADQLADLEARMTGRVDSLAASGMITQSGLESRFQESLDTMRRELGAVDGRLWQRCQEIADHPGLPPASLTITIKAPPPDGPTNFPPELVKIAEERGVSAEQLREMMLDALGGRYA